MFKRIVMTLILLSILTAGLYAEEEKKAAGKKPAITYGDYCESPYGYCDREMTMQQAHQALRVFFKKRGLHPVVRAHMGRFVKADIYDGPYLVDSIILDRRTGKMRSIY